MKRFLYLFIYLAGSVWGYSSLSVSSSKRATIDVPAVAPFTALGDYRFEFRVHNLQTSTNVLSLFTFGIYPYNVSAFVNATATEICSDNGGGDTAARHCANIAGYSDVLVRIQRLGSVPSVYGGVGSFGIEAWDATTGKQVASYCGAGHPNQNAFCPIKSAPLKNWSIYGGAIGNSYTTSFSMAWLKWFSTTVALNGPPPKESDTADLADFRFESNLDDQATGHYGVTALPAQLVASYGGTPKHPPACIIESGLTYRAGAPAQLDGARSYALNGDTDLTYFWRQARGPTTASISQDGTAKPVVSGTVFGSYDFRLTVTDSDKSSTSCETTAGFVATDDRDVVITGKPAVDVLLGHMIRYGANPWPWADNRHKTLAELHMARMAADYPAYWASNGPGMISVSTGGASVTGSGTSFTTTFCQGPASPSVPKSGAAIIVWYPNDSSEGYGLRKLQVASCQSDTLMTLASNWLTDVADCGSEGCKYSYSDGALDAAWNAVDPPAPNYYDTVAAWYALYYRTGLEQYLTAARTFADRFWKYRLDSGNVCSRGSCANQRWVPRTQSLLGMTLRALDGRPDMWTGLRKLSRYWEQERYLGLQSKTLYDIREQGYALAGAAYVAMFDPDPSSRNTAKTAIGNAIATMWAPTQSADGSWKQMISRVGSWGGTGGGGSVTLTQGSTIVVGNGTSWDSSLFPPDTHIAFLATTAKPASYAEQEPRYYTPDFVDSTHLRLDRPYEGPNAGPNRGWMLSASAGDPTAVVGWMAQPFIEGILGTAFGFVNEALKDTDLTRAGLARDFVVDIAQWQKNYAYRESVKGMQYFAGSADCQPPISETSTWCTGKYSVTQARTLSAEALRSVMLGYSLSGDPSLLQFGDALYNAMYAKPGTCPKGSSVCVEDGHYVTDLNDADGWYMTGKGAPYGSGQIHKWLGMFFGIGAGADWPAYRLGGVLPPTMLEVQLGFSMPARPAGATGVQVKTTAPTGEVSATNCSSSPCKVTVDRRAGEHIHEMDYLSPEGAVLAASKLPLIRKR